METAVTSPRPAARSAPPSFPAASRATDPGATDPRADECRRLLALSLEEVFDDPAAAVGSTRRAVALADALAAEDGDEPRWIDLQAEAVAHHANAERVAADLAAAQTTMARAQQHLAAGSGDPALAARVLELAASLDRETGQPDAALRKLQRAAALHREAGADDAFGRVLVQEGVLLAYVGDYGHSLEVLRQAFEFLVPKQDPRSVLAATQCLAFCLHQVGYDIAAAGLLAEAVRVVERRGDRIVSLRLRWLGARIQIALGHDGETELRRVRDGFLQRGMVYDAALACLDLADHYARRQRLPDLRALALEMFPIFTSRQIHREALAALILLRDTLSSGRADLGLLAELRAFLERSRFDKRLRFRTA